MIYYIILYEFESGKSLTEISFQEDEEFLKLFGSFFTALNTFMTSLIFHTSKKIQLIELDNYIIKFTHIMFEKEYDLIIICDKTELLHLDDIISEIKEVIYQYADVFINWDGHSTYVFKELETAIRKSLCSWMEEKHQKIPINKLPNL